MTHSAADPPRKPRRLGLYIPWGIAAALTVGWSLAWLALMHVAEQRFDAGAAALRQHGWQAGWATRHVGGYPFRLDVDVTELRLADPSGWGVSAPALKTEAYAFAPTHWVFFAPAGLTFTRPEGGAVRVDAGALRGSVSGVGQHPPRIALEGDDLTFTPAPGAKPFLLTAARNLQVYTRPGPGDQGAFYLSLEQARGDPAGWLGQLAGDAPSDLAMDGTFSHASALAGPDWRASVLRWSHSGGMVSLQHLTLSTAGVQLASRAGATSVDATGRLAGSIDLAFGGPDRGQSLKLNFGKGEMRLGSTPVGPAPRIF